MKRHAFTTIENDTGSLMECLLLCHLSFSVSYLLLCAVVFLIICLFSPLIHSFVICSFYRILIEVISLSLDFIYFFFRVNIFLSYHLVYDEFMLIELHNIFDIIIKHKFKALSFWDMISKHFFAFINFTRNIKFMRKISKCAQYFCNNLLKSVTNKFKLKKIIEIQIINCN